MQVQGRDSSVSPEFFFTRPTSSSILPATKNGWMRFESATVACDHFFVATPVSTSAKKPEQAGFFAAFTPSSEALGGGQRGWGF
jgi:hypothetical protein